MSKWYFLRGESVLLCRKARPFFQLFLLLLPFSLSVSNDARENNNSDSKQQTTITKKTKASPKTKKREKKKSASQLKCAAGMVYVHTVVSTHHSLEHKVQPSNSLLCPAEYSKVVYPVFEGPFVPDFPIPPSLSRPIILVYFSQFFAVFASFFFSFLFFSFNFLSIPHSHTNYYTPLAHTAKTLLTISTTTTSFTPTTPFCSIAQRTFFCNILFFITPFSFYSLPLLHSRTYIL